MLIPRLATALTLVRQHGVREPVLCDIGRGVGGLGCSQPEGREEGEMGIAQSSSSATQPAAPRQDSCLPPLCYSETRPRGGS